MSVLFEAAKPGTIVYDRAGRQAEYVTPLPKGYHLVRPGIEIYSQDPDVREDITYEGVAEWHEVFLKPPVDKLNEEVAALNAKLEDLRKAIRVRADEQRVLDAQMATRKERIKQHEQLAQLDDYIAGKITHFVVETIGYSNEGLRAIAIETFKDALAGEDSWNRGKLKLLALFGDSKGDLSYGTLDYAGSMSSSSNVRVHPCTSLEQAREVARKLYEGAIDAWRKSVADLAAGVPKSGVWFGPLSIIQHGKKLDLPVPQDAIDAVHRQAVESATSQLEAARKAVLIAEADLSAAQIGAAPEDRPGRPVAPKAH